MTNEREARREARKRAAHRRVEPDAAPAGETAIRSKPVRITADLAPELYRRLDKLTSRAAEEIDAAKVPAVALVRAWIRASDDPEVWAKVLVELRQDKQ
ncbi:hypothetical protein ACQP10_38510 (plasmid) [Streptosporangium sandarakinum]|uniref:hypothetical protein n=1 Tax=Streptosporangium sandarakinum TaxID=1260955 RepID=UPI003D89C767